MPLRATALLVAALVTGATPVTAEPSMPSISVSVDQARILRIDRAAETIIVGNPAIVDVAIHDALTLILTGRSFGVTNIVVLDGQGEAVVDENVVVNASETASVRVFRQAQRSTYSCAPTCQPTVTVGDTAGTFGAAAGQFSERESFARSQ